MLAGVGLAIGRAQVLVRAPFMLASLSCVAGAVSPAGHCPQKEQGRSVKQLQAIHVPEFP
jgi:hypothetical protein